MLTLTDPERKALEELNYLVWDKHTSPPLEKLHLCVNLEILSLYGSDLKTQTIEEMGLSHLTKLQELNLNVNQITKLPSDFGKLTGLTKLDLANNQLKDIPREIARLVLLTYLNASSNRIEQLPLEIGELVNLEQVSSSWDVI
jgi:Leucine-rich repeat (LRR) protein